MHPNTMEWSDETRYNLEHGSLELVMEPYQYPYRSKDRGDVWNKIAINLNGLDHPRFKVNKRSVRDRLTLLITKYKAKVRKEKNASGISCVELELDQALEEIIDKEKLADEKSSDQRTKKGGKNSGRGAQENRHGTFKSDKKKETRKVKPLEPTQKGRK